MKAFKAKHPGRCPTCRKVITKGQSIVKMEKPITWLEQQRLIPHGRGRFFTDRKSSQYAHAECVQPIPLEDH